MLEQTMSKQEKRQKITLNKSLGDNDDMNNCNLIPKDSKHKPQKSKIKWNIANIGGSSNIKLPKEVLDVDHVIIAEQISIMQFNLFQKIHPRECINLSWKD